MKKVRFMPMMGVDRKKFSKNNRRFENGLFKNEALPGKG